MIVSPSLRSLLFVGTVILTAIAPRMRAAAAESTVQGLVGYWAFDEGRGERAANAVRRSPDIFGNTGAVRVVAPVWVPGKRGAALDFGAGKTAGIVEKLREFDCTEALTVAAWIRLDQPQGRGMILNYEYAYRLFVSAGPNPRVGFQLDLDGNWAGNWLLSRSTLKRGRWYHVAGVYDGKERRVFLDGRLEGAEPAHGSLASGRGFVLGGAGIRRNAQRRVHPPGPVGYRVQEAFPGVVDEVRVWNRALTGAELRRAAEESQSEVLARLPAEKDLHFYVVRCVCLAGKETPFQLVVFNGGKHLYDGKLRVSILDADGRPLFEKQQPIRVAGRRKKGIEVPAPGQRPGEYTVVVSAAGQALFTMPARVLAPDKRQPVGEPPLRKVLTVDLAQDLPPELLCDDRTSRVVQSTAGSYREAGTKKFSRFVVRLPLHRTGLHLVRVTYPDDKERTCEIASWSPVPDDRFNCHSGYFTGGDYPLSGKMQRFEFVLWARSVDQALVFTTWLDDQPAAAATIEVFEIEGRLPSRPASRVPTWRFLGHYWEDAQPLSRCFGGGAPNLAGFDRVVRNLCDYFDYTGQNLLMHPVVWYEGPIYNSLVEARGGKGGFHLPTAGWLDILLDRFEERGFKFYGLFNVHQLPSLVKTMNADPAAIRAGASTFNTVSSDGEVSVKTWHHRMALFNALHPKVQERVLALVRELADRYGASPAFAGIGFHLTLAQLLQPGSLDVSYDDWTVGRFEKDTGVHVPVSTKDPDRFGKRYRWLMNHARDKWIDWRCRCTAGFYGRVAHTLRRKRSDLQLVVTLLEPPMSIIDPQRLAWLDGKSLVEQAREAGIDPVLLAQLPGVVLQQRLGPSAKRKRLTFGVSRGRWGCPPPTPENIAAIRAMDLDTRQQREFRTTTPFGVFLYNRYFESAVGRTHPLKSDWYTGVPWRASAVVPAHEHFLDYYAHAVAMFDPTFMTTGGFTNGTVGHERQVERFARVFRQLPVGEWREIPGLNAGVVGRTFQDHGKQYLSLVNTTPDPCRVSLSLQGSFHPLADSPRLFPTGNRLATDLRPYELAAWMNPDTRSASRVSATAPASGFLSWAGRRSTARPVALHARAGNGDPPAVVPDTAADGTARTAFRPHGKTVEYEIRPGAS